MKAYTKCPKEVSRIIQNRFNFSGAPAPGSPLSGRPLPYLIVPPSICGSLGATVLRMVTSFPHGFHHSAGLYVSSGRWSLVVGCDGFQRVLPAALWELRAVGPHSPEKAWLGQFRPS